MSAKLIERIRRCLALAASAAGTPEGTAARSRAEAIAAKAGVDLASVQVDRPTEAPIREFQSCPSSMWRASLGWAIAPYAGVSVLRDGDGKRLIIIGRKADIDLWRILYLRAEAEIDAEGRRYAAQVDYYRSARSEGDTFRKAAASGFGQRLARAKAEAEASDHGRASAAALVSSVGVDGPGTGLVLASRALEVKKAADHYYPKTRTVKIGSSGSSSARADGHRFGSSMGIHRGNLASA